MNEHERVAAAALAAAAKRATELAWERGETEVRSVRKAVVELCLWGAERIARSLPDERQSFLTGHILAYRHSIEGDDAFFWPAVGSVVILARAFYIVAREGRRHDGG